MTNPRERSNWVNTKTEKLLKAGCGNYDLHQPEVPENSGLFLENQPKTRISARILPKNDRV